MISTNKAKILIERATAVGEHKNEELLNAIDHVLARDISSPIDLPQFDQSAMDGYAIKLGEGDEFNVLGEIQAGDNAENIVLNKNEAVKIFTGAMCPSSADLVCRIEDIEESPEDAIKVIVMPKIGANIRRQGEQIRQGDFALAKGHKVSPATIGFLANLGMTHVSVYSKPRVSVLSTGNELISPGEKLELGKIYESNAQMLQSVLRESDISDLDIHKSVDTLEETVSKVGLILEKSDIVIITGGISVGDYDFVAEALKKNDIEKVFHKLNQKPGKPFYFGKKGSKLVFALPGNPAAVLTCYYQYVLPAIQKTMGNEFVGLDSQFFKSKSAISKSNSREQFLKGYYEDGFVEVLEGQSSAMLHTFATSNALVYVPADKKLVVGEAVLVYKIR